MTGSGCGAFIIEQMSPAGLFRDYKKTYPTFAQKKVSLCMNTGLSQIRRSLEALFTGTNLIKFLLNFL